LNLSAARRSLPARSAGPWLAAAAALAVAVGASLLATNVMMAPPARELREMARYLALSGVATLVLGWLVVRLTGEPARLSMRARLLAGAIAGTAIALVNVAVLARLMFISTDHDLKLLVALLIFAGIVTSFFIVRLTLVLSARVETVAAGVRALARGDDTLRVAVTGKDDVARLATDVNALAASLREARRQQDALDRERRELTAAISHDLRTPLSSLRAMMEALDDGIVDDPAEVTRYLATMRREIDRLSRMIDDLFELARIDAGAVQHDLRTVALQEIAADVVDAMQAQARRQSVELTLRVEEEPPPLLIDGARVERAIANLVRNALAHTPAPGRVGLVLGRDDGFVSLQVSDSGAGIGDGDLDLIWQRFYRGDKSRGHEHGSPDGAGLGLAIVKGIVEAHGGDVAVTSTPGAGATFTVRLPVTDN